MKKILSVIFTFAIVLSISACGENGTTVENKTEDTTTVGEEIETTTTESSTEEITTTVEGVVENGNAMEYKNAIPNPLDIFINGSVDECEYEDGTGFIYSVSNCSEEEYDQYVKECKDKGFTDITYETNVESQNYSIFGAFSSDGKYWVQLENNRETSSVNISCTDAKNIED